MIIAERTHARAQADAFGAPGGLGNDELGRTLMLAEPDFLETEMVGDLGFQDILVPGFAEVSAGRRLFEKSPNSIGLLFRQPSSVRGRNTSLAPALAPPVAGVRAGFDQRRKLRNCPRGDPSSRHGRRRSRLSGESFMQTLGLGFTWEQLSAGQRFRTLNRTVTETDLVLFTGMTGMLESIFIDRTFGVEKGAIQGQFVPAALTYSLIEGLLCQSMIQGTGLAMLELTQQVRAPVRVGDTVHGEIEVISVRPTSTGNRGIVVSKIDVKNQNDEVVMTYQATRMLAGRSADRGTA
jgi:3-hydroxybutyryl-CoA dehydratase